MADDREDNDLTKKTPLNKQLTRVKPKLTPRTSRSMYVPVQQTYYGPKGTLKKVTDDYLM